MIFIETERAILRNFTEDDLQDVFKYASIDGVGEMAGWKHHENIEETKAVLYKILLQEKDNYAIVDKETDHVIGSFGLHLNSTTENDFPEEKVKEVGYVLSKDYWGKGIVPEVLEAALLKWKEDSDIQVITAITSNTNKASIHVLEKCGFRHYKIMKDVYLSATDSIVDKYYFYKRIGD